MLRISPSVADHRVERPGGERGVPVQPRLVANDGSCVRLRPESVHVWSHDFVLPTVMDKFFAGTS